MEKKTQTEQIFDHLAAGHSLTPQQALQQFGCFRLAAIVHRLKYRACPIVNITPDGRHATYRMDITDQLDIWEFDSDFPARR